MMSNFLHCYYTMYNIHICILRHLFRVTLLTNFDIFLCLRVRFHKSLFWVPIWIRGEYFYLVGGAHLQLILFSSCRNIQFGVFRAEIFILWCIVQKYWSGIVTCYMKMRQINELHADLASFLLNCARKKHFLGGFVQKCHFFWGLCRNITVPSYCTSGVLCRAFFRGCAEILIFGEIFTSVYHTWASADPLFAEVADKYPGVRILRQDPVENVFSFICSANNHISRSGGCLCLMFMPCNALTTGSQAW